MGPAASPGDSKNTHDETENNEIQIPVHNSDDQDGTLPVQESTSANEPYVIKPTQSASAGDTFSPDLSDEPLEASTPVALQPNSQFSEPPVQPQSVTPQAQSSFTPDTQSQPMQQQPVPSNTPLQPAPIPSTDNLFAPDANAPAAIGAQKGPQKKKAVLFVGILAIVMLLGGAFAAAYYGIVIPNRPENVLLQAVKNTSQQQYVSSTAKIDIAPTGNSQESAMPAFKVESKGSIDTSNGQSESTNKLTMTGVDVTLDTKYVDENIYLKVGDLKTVTSLASSYLGGSENPQLKGELDKVTGVIENQWIEIDSTILDQAQVSCTLDSDYRLTDKDLQLLEDQFNKHQFITINNHSDDKVSGQKAIKYQLTLDAKKAGEFIDDKKLEELSLVKKLEKCSENENTSPEALKDNVDTDSIGDEKYTFDLWVDAKEKVISKVSFATEDQSKKPEDVRAAVEVTMTYNKVSITKPENAKPALQLWGELQQVSPTLFGSLGGMFGDTSSEDDSEMNMDMNGQSGDVIFQGEVYDDL